MCPVLALRGLPRGAASRAFSSAELAAALAAPLEGTVYAELDAEGWLVAAGAGAGRRGAGGGGGAVLAVRARLAPHVHARTASVQLLPAVAAGGAGGERWVLRLEAGAAPHAELLVWFDERALALLDVPFLTLRNILGKKNYACHECGIEFEEPNPLKVHLFLSCEAPSPPGPRALWARVLARLAPPPAPEPTPAPAPSPAQLEALAAEWGRSPAGHLCLYCGKLYSRKYGLKIHIRTHTGYKPLRCRYCARAFGDPSNLNKHVRLHGAGAGHAGPAGAGAGHACARCGAVLARRRDLERHERAKHAPATPAPAPTAAAARPVRVTPLGSGSSLGNI